MSNNVKIWLLIIAMTLVTIAVVVGVILFRIYLVKIGIDYLGETLGK